MSGPPDMPASQLWRALTDMPRPSKVVDFPRRGPDGNPVGQLRIWILTQEEQMKCTKSAEDFAKSLLKNGKQDDRGYNDLYANAVCVEVLSRACRDVEDVSKPAFPAAGLLRQQLTTEEAGALFSHYLTVQLELGPIESQMSDVEIDAWISRLQEGGSAFPFDLLSSDMQKILLLSMAGRLESSPKATSSAGSQPDDPSSDEASEPDQAPSLHTDRE